MTERKARRRSLKCWCPNQGCWPDQTREEWRVADCPDDGTNIVCPICGDPVRASAWSDIVFVACQHCGKPLEGRQVKWCGQDCYIIGNRSITWYYQPLKEQQAGLCGICLLPLQYWKRVRKWRTHEYMWLPYDDGHVDHIVPRHRGGADAVENFAATHATCNLRKSTKTLEEARSDIGMTDEVVAGRLLHMALPASERARLRGGPIPSKPATPSDQQVLFDG